MCETEIRHLTPPVLPDGFPKGPYPTSAGPMPAKKATLRLPPLTEDQLNPAQRALLESMRAGPRGRNLTLAGPFGCYMHAPEVGEVIQQFAAFCRFKTRLPKRLSEFAILVIGQMWKAQYEFYVHAREAEQAGVLSQTIRDIKAGRVPAKAAKDERALYDFIKELHQKRRVSDRTYARVHALVGDGGMVEFLALLGSYTLTSMVLNTFRVPLPEGATPPFKEPALR
jgi:4-carboxymuconolactone decarboxylase